MRNSFRLNSDSMFERPEESNKEPPLRIVFLSVEGNKTEQNYFEWIEKYREQLGIKSRIHVHPLRRSQNDTLSAPEHVNEAMRGDFETLLQQAGIDLEYEYFLKEYSGKYDVFGVVIDRDYVTHSVTQMNKIQRECKEKGYHFFVTTPCFEFWLLMHLVDICSVYIDDLQAFRDNNKKSNKHTFTSLEVSKHAHHSKGIKEDIFKSCYLFKVDYAISQAKESFSSNIDELIGTDESDETKKGKLGSNLPDLFDLLREIK